MHQPAQERLRQPRVGRRLALLLALALFLPGSAAEAQPANAPSLNARAWVLIDARDGEVLAARRASRSYPVASTTKLMTAFVARRALDLKDVVVAPKYEPSFSAESLLGLRPGERITVRDLLYGLLLASGNDAAVALASAAGGTVPKFVEKMNKTAQRLGLRNTSYANPIGLDDPDNYSSAADLAKLAARMREDGKFAEIFDTPSATLQSGAKTRHVVNRNNLVRNVPWVDGVKTGYTLSAGNVLVASGKRKGVDLISAVLGAPSEAVRDSASLELLEYGFSLYRREQPVKNGETLATAGIAYQDGSVDLVAANGVRVTLREGQKAEVEIDVPSEVEGPLEAGERVGEAVVLVDGSPRGRTPIVAAAAVPKATVADRVDAALPGPRFVAWALLTVLLAAAAIALMRLFRHRRGR